MDLVGFGPDVVPGIAEAGPDVVAGVGDLVRQALFAVGSAPRLAGLVVGLAHRLLDVCLRVFVSHRNDLPYWRALRAPPPKGARPGFGSRPPRPSGDVPRV